MHGKEKKTKSTYPNIQKAIDLVIDDTSFINSSNGLTINKDMIPTMR